jgi:hypothetical protein
MGRHVSNECCPITEGIFLVRLRTVSLDWARRFEGAQFSMSDDSCWVLKVLVIEVSAMILALPLLLSEGEMP